ncbi:Crp/Fnr family transcriptional regulator [Filimonas effusa]|uniref:Crp/Fnr family transcriptional regulator n=1 Tax=Filimonas effusa TaxID=2508721 RepID=A0A4Q1DCB6_9BACT|nr:Crp/Fnr family transcriptional regulator [Filimonas effusa]RXK87154.1 Crp/Fnr family transcriptional regulator [Filimonas effusa]
MESLLTRLHAIQTMSADLETYLRAHVQTKQVNKNEYILRANTISRHIFFVEYGLFRCFYEVGDQEISSWFMKEQDIIIAVSSFFKQESSNESIQALEPALVHYISYDHLQQIYLKFPEFNIHGRLLTEKYYIQCDERLFAIRGNTAAERYAFIMKKHPEMILRIPSKFLASYLDISVYTLSRLRKMFK